MSTPVVVQGTAVSAPQQTQQVAFGGETLETEQTPTKTGCKDPIFALLFYGNVAAIIAVCGIYGTGAIEGSSGTDSSEYSMYVF